MARVECDKDPTCDVDKLNEELMDGWADLASGVADGVNQGLRGNGGYGNYYGAPTTYIYD